MKEFRLPAPPGHYRINKFSQTFKNGLDDSVILYDYSRKAIEIATLEAGQEAQLEWCPSNNEGHPDGNWKVNRPI